MIQCPDPLCQTLNEDGREYCKRCKRLLEPTEVRRPADNLTDHAVSEMRMQLARVQAETKTLQDKISALESEKAELQAAHGAAKEENARLNVVLDEKTTKHDTVLANLEERVRVGVRNRGLLVGAIGAAAGLALGAAGMGLIPALHSSANVDALLSKADSCVKSQNASCALDAVFDVLKEDPRNAKTKEILTEIKKIVENAKARSGPSAAAALDLPPDKLAAVKKLLRANLVAGHNCLKSQDYACAMGYADMVLQVEPGNEEAREIRRSAETATVSGTPTTLSPAHGTVYFNVVPWARIYVDGVDAGVVTPPIKRITLPEGTHKIELRNPAGSYTADVEILKGREVSVEHAFGK